MTRLKKIFIPERLIEAREVRGYTKADLARQLGISRQAISQFEKGTTSPGSSTIISLTRILRMPLNYFFTERPRMNSRTSPLYFRKRNSATKISRIQGARLEEWFADIVGFLSSYFDMPDVRVLDCDKEPKLVSRRDIESLALELRRFWGLGLGPINNLTRLLENHGLILGKTKLSGLMDSYSCWRQSKANIILTNANISSVRFRFNLAHELGHLILHRHIDEHEFESRENHKLFEDQANAFASSFLMPEETFVNDFLSPSIEALLYLKKRWLVSIQAIAIRCLQLSLISESQYENIFRTLNARYDGRRKEPLDNEIPMEVPILVSHSMQVLIDKGIASQEKILMDLNLPIQELVDFSNLSIDVFDRDNVLVMPRD